MGLVEGGKGGGEGLPDSDLGVGEIAMVGGNSGDLAIGGVVVFRTELMFSWTMATTSRIWVPANSGLMGTLRTPW